MHLYAWLSLTTPMMLGGLALLALPLLAHLLNRRARRRIVFPTIRLLTASAASQSKLFKLRRWILLALRSLAVALVVAAFARPIWMDAAAAPSDGQASAVVVLVDASASAAQQTDGVQLVHTLRAEASRTLDSLSSGDVADVVQASARPQAVFGRMSPNLPALREEVARIEASHERADLPQALALVGELLARHDGPRRLVIHSDWQASNWQEAIRDADLAQLLPPDTRVTFVEVGTEPPDNVALAHPRSFPPQPLANQPAQLAVRATNFSAREKQVRIDLTLDGVPAAAQTLTLSAGEERDVAFETVLENAGRHEAAFATQVDGLAADNHAYLVVKAAQRLPVVIVSDDDPAEPGTGSYFIARALAPFEGEGDRHEVRHVTGEAVAGTDLSPAAAVFVGYLGELAPESAAALISYVRQGGGLVVFCGEGAVPRRLEALAAAGGEGGQPPWRAGAARDLAALDDALHITEGRWQSRLLREFDEQSQIAIAQIPFGRVWSVAGLEPDAQVLLSFSDGTPALALRSVGAGQLLLANFSPSLESSEFGKYGAFVALVQILAKGLRPARDAAGANLVGQPYHFPGSFAADADPLSVVGPGDETAPATTSTRANQVVVHIDRPALPGVYRVRRGSETLDAAAINVDPRESDLSRIDRGELLTKFEAGGVGLDLRSAEGWTPVLRTRGRPLWGWFVAAALAAIGVELFCLGYWRR